VYYVQYAHARVRSLWRKAEAAGIMTTDEPLLEDEAEIAVARKIAEWPRLVEIAARNHEPHRVAFYLYELASGFHALWNKGNDSAALRFIHEDDETRSAAKMALARAVGVVISTGLGILGVTPAEEMR
jgi:arginyl-tRNA synthetase